METTVSKLTLADSFVFRKQKYNAAAIVESSSTHTLKELWAYRVDDKGNEFGRIATFKPGTKVIV
jgi:hypothetical protein